MSPLETYLRTHQVVDSGTSSIRTCTSWGSTVRTVPEKKMVLRFSLPCSRRLLHKYTYHIYLSLSMERCGTVHFFAIVVHVRIHASGTCAFCFLVRRVFIYINKQGRHCTPIGYWLRCGQQLQVDSTHELLQSKELGHDSISFIATPPFIVIIIVIFCFYFVAFEFGFILIKHIIHVTYAPTASTIIVSERTENPKFAIYYRTDRLFDARRQWGNPRRKSNNDSAIVKFKSDWP